MSIINFLRSRNQTIGRTLFLLVIPILFAVLVPSYTSAQSADSAERAARQCVDGGGTWDGATATCGARNGCDLSRNILGIPTWYKYLNTKVDSTGRCSPVLIGTDTEGRANSALPIGLAILEMMLRVAGLVAVAMVFVGAFKYLTSQGNPDNAKGAQKTVMNAIIGLIIVIISTGVVSFLGNSLVQ